MSRPKLSCKGEKEGTTIIREGKSDFDTKSYDNPSAIEMSKGSVW